MVWKSSRLGCVCPTIPAQSDVGISLEEDAAGHPSQSAPGLQKLFPVCSSALELLLLGAKLGWDREPDVRWDFHPMDKILVQCPGEG